jgi:hypothetical protein
VLGTLLHEAAHGLADRRRITDTSRGGRYHNRRYSQLAEELGLQVAQVHPIGWSATPVPDATTDCYADVLGDLTERLVLWRHHNTPDGGAGSRNLLAHSCGCPRRIRVARPPCRAHRSSSRPASCRSPLRVDAYAPKDDA